MHYLPFLSTLVTFAFAAAVFRRYLVKHGPYLLLWGIGLVLFGIGTLSEVILAFTFSGLVLKLWYLCGAMLTAAWPVSYTHLRAHETRHDLVCRLLLEKK